MIKSRVLTRFSKNNYEVKTLLKNLLENKSDVNCYRNNMRMLGEQLALALVPMLSMEKNESICVICTVEDADYLARGLIDILEHKFQKIRLLCMWNERIKHHNISITPIRKSYIEKFNQENSIFIIVKSIISGSCVVKTNLTRAITNANPKSIFVAAPVMYKEAEMLLNKEFSREITERFKYVSFAIDSKRSEDGSEVIPGIGGSVYELYGFKDEADKNRYIPNLVKERRKREVLTTASELRL